MEKRLKGLFTTPQTWQDSISHVCAYLVRPPTPLMKFDYPAGDNAAQTSFPLNLSQTFFSSLEIVASPWTLWYLVYTSTTVPTKLVTGSPEFPAVFISSFLHVSSLCHAAPVHSVSKVVCFSNG